MKINPTLAAMLGVSLFSFCAAGSRARAQSVDPDAKTTLDHVAAAYKGLTAFSATINTTQTANGTEHKSTTKLVLQKPLKLAAEVRVGDDVNHIVADGTNVYADSTRDKSTYLKHPVATFKDAISELARGGGAGVGLLPILLTDDNAASRMIPGSPATVKRGPDETVGGDACDTVTAVIGSGDNGMRVAFAASKQDHLLRRVSLGRGTASDKPVVVETYSNVSTQPAITDALFKYTPPPGATASAAPKEPVMYDPRLKPGASPLPLVGKDLAGADVSLAQYKGKVLLIDFWATWCGPCVAELPNVIAAYGKYHPKGFEIVGVSLDQADARQKLTSFIAAKKMPWRQIYDGKYWEAANAKAYGVQSIPFTLLVGKDGKIAAVGARGEALAPAIEAALKQP